MGHASLPTENQTHLHKFWDHHCHAMKVYDRWWPWRIGQVIKSTAQGKLVVQWIDTGEMWAYDKEHIQFLEVLKG